MAFGGFGNTSGGFGSGGGFGSTNNAGSGFGTSNASSGGMFGANTATTGGGFGSGGGFGNTATTTGGSLFGGANTTSTSGGFGSAGGGFGANNNTASTGFGGNATGGGIFGANKPATGGFGTSNTGSMFGGANNTTSTGFGGNNAASNPFGGTSTTTSAGFGAANTNTSTGFGGGGFGASNTQNNSGTGGTPFSATQEKDGATNQTSHYQSITFQQPYQSKSFEELRVEDYLQGRRYGNSNGQAGSFGQSTGFGNSLFGGNNATANTNNTSGGSLFGGNNTATTNTGFGGGFGSNTQQQTGGGFGSNAGGSGLFGSQNKPAGNLFGNTSSATATGGFGSTAVTTGGLFGSNNNNNNTATTGFGTNNTANTGGSLFGNNNNQQNKPAFGTGFGSSTTTAGGFGQTNTNSGGSLFGGNANTNTNSGGGLFGSNNNQPQQQNSNPFGGNTNTGGSLFGAQQNKPATGGLFGSSTTNNTGGSLFGANNHQTQQASGGIFGTSTNNNSSGGLFGNTQQNKPAGGSLFGGAASNTNTGGGLFGSNTQQSNTGGSLFGGNTNANTAGGSLFGGTHNKPAGGLFGSNTGNTNTGGGLFGGMNNSQQQQNSSGNSLFGSNNNQNQNSNSLFGSMNQGPNQNQQNQLHASLTLSPYGNDQLFSSLGQSSAPIGPLATPLQGARPAPIKAPSLLSSTRLNSPVYTPRGSNFGRNGGYGFSYSTYGTPGSAYSTSLTPQASSLLKPTGSLGSALTSRLAKSMSMNNLRGQTPTRDGDSLLRPTPGSASSRYLNSGNMRRLTIDRNLRTDLFSPPSSLSRIESAGDADSPGLKKKVSFDNAAGCAKQTDTQPSLENALVRTETSDEEEASPAATRSQAKVNGRPEMEQVNGAKSLAGIPEDIEPQRPSSAPGTKKPVEKIPGPLKDVHVGRYYCKPSIKDLKNMSRSQLAKVGKFVVGRDGVGKVEFGRDGGVDLTSVELDNIFDDDDLSKDYDGNSIVQLKIRSATVYPIADRKPPRGKGLNVPSRIYLENSWPRSHGGRRAVLQKSGPAYDKHIQRFKTIKGTQFVDYIADKGIWVFDVDHFTTYGIDDDGESLYSEEDDMEGVEQDSSGLSDPPVTPAPGEDTIQSIESANGAGEVDDTFEFKLTNTGRSKTSLSSVPIPGGFDDSQAASVSYDYNDPSAEEDMEDDHMMSGSLGDVDDMLDLQGGAVQAPSERDYSRHNSSMALDTIRSDDIAEDLQDELEPKPELPGSFMPEEPKMLRSILKPSTVAGSFSAMTSPEKLASDAWEEQLQRTMSPKKRDRQALRDLQNSMFHDDQEAGVESPFKRSMLGQSTLNQSYLAQKSSKKVGFSTGFEERKAELGKSQAFRTSMDLMNSLWAQEKTNTGRGAAPFKGFENPYTKKPRLSAYDDLDDNELAFHDCMKPTFSNNGCLVFQVGRYAYDNGSFLTPALKPISGERGPVRFARIKTSEDTNGLALSEQKNATHIVLSHGFPQARTDSPLIDLTELAKHSQQGEKAIWSLTSILFESVKISCADLIRGMSDAQISEYESRLRKDAFSAFWTRLVAPFVDEQLSGAKSPECKALVLLTKNDINGAAEVLAKGGNFHLATLVAQMPGTADSRSLIEAQIKAWQSRNDWSEMSSAIRAIYSLLAGETCVVAGKNGAKEDRVPQFTIAEKFGLNWMQSVSLRVHYGGFNNLEQAVKQYVNDIADGRETTLPLPFWSNGSDASATGREDTLLGLLRLASTTRAYPADLEALFDPKTVSGSSVNSRLAWQLATILCAKGWADYLAVEKLDQLTRDYASELENAGHIISAAWVLLHIADAKAREVLVRELLMRNGGSIPEPLPADADASTGEADVWRLLSDLKIPEQLLWESMALYARADRNDSVLQAHYLIAAQLFDDAHEVLVTSIGPAAVIEEEYDDLLDLVAKFPDPKPTGWAVGGRIYLDFAKLVTMNLQRKRSKDGRSCMERLGLGLEAMGNADGSDKMALEQKVALVEMGRVLKEEARNVDIDELNAVSGMDGVLAGHGLWERYQRGMGLMV